MAVFNSLSVDAIIELFMTHGKEIDKLATIPKGSNLKLTNGQKPSLFMTQTTPFLMETSQIMQSLTNYGNKTVSSENIDKGKYNILHHLAFVDPLAVLKLHPYAPKAFKRWCNEWNHDHLRPYYIAICMGVRDNMVLKLLFTGINDKGNKLPITKIAICNKNMTQEESYVYQQAKQKRISKFVRKYE